MTSSTLTATHCEPPAWSLTNVRPAADIDPRERAVEEILALRHDVDDHDLAVTLLRGVRPDLERGMVEDWIEQLLARAADVHETLVEGPRTRFDVACDAYEDTLAMFCRSPR